MPEQTSLQKECRAFTRYLIDIDPDAYVSERYAAAIRQVQALAVQSGFDRLLLRMARIHPLLTCAVDVYSRFFVHASVVRRRLVMLLAIIESSAPTADRLERPDHRGLVGFIAGMAWRSVVLAMLLLVAILTLLPAQLLLGKQVAGQVES